MYLSLNWIKKFVSLPDVLPKQLATDLTMSSVEVEDVIEQSQALNGVVIGQIKELVKHPQADKLWICKTDIGEQVVQIVCGGSNLKEGMKVAVAKIGAKVKWHGQSEVVTIEKVKIRGQESNGMIAAASELGLENLFTAEDERQVIDLSAYNFKPGVSLSGVLNLNDVILEIDNKSMTHRPDLWGQYGLARELAAIYDKKLKPLKLAEIVKDSGHKKIDVSVKSPSCYRYSGLVMDNIKVGPSPWWLRISLESVGLRSINNIVDVTNYVMMELGQPLHAFDYQLLEGQGVVVRELDRVENFQTLDGFKHKLPVGTLMIGDKKKNVAIAGIMGGLNSEIKDNTTAIFLESANFQASKVRHVSMKLGLRTDASTRFEKSLDPTLTMPALQRAVSLIKLVCPEATVVSKTIDIDNRPDFNREIILDRSLLVRLLGIELEDKVVKDILQRLGFTVVKKKGIFTVGVPSWRATKDITIAEDLVEEIARIYGYSNIAPVLPVVKLKQPDANIEKKLENQIKDMLAYNSDYIEVYNYSFAEPLWTPLLGLAEHQVEVKNALTEDQRYMRTSLLPWLMKNVDDNIRWQDDFRLFEFGRVFKAVKGSYHVDTTGKDFLPEQNLYFSGVTVSKEKSEQQLYLQTKGMLQQMLAHYNLDFSLELEEMPFSHLRQVFKSHDQKFGSFGLLNSEIAGKYFEGHKVVWWELNFSKLVKHADFSRTFSALPKYPTVVRDLAVVVEQNVSWENLSKEISAASPLIEEVDLFDIFQSKELGTGKHSLAFSIVFRSPDRTLESKEIEAVMAKIKDRLKNKFSARQR